MREMSSLLFKLIGPAFRWFDRHYIYFAVIDFMNPSQECPSYRVRCQISVRDKTWINHLKWILKGKEFEFKILSIKPELPCPIERGRPLELFCDIGKLVNEMKKWPIDLFPLKKNELKIRVCTESGHKELNFNNAELTTVINKAIKK